MEKIESDNYEVYMVGGCVRDYVLGLVPNDIDIATNAPVEYIKNSLGGTYISENSELDVFSVNGIEVARYRIEANYNTKRTPCSVKYDGVTIEEDCSRRDFTMNSMYMDRHLKVYDPFNGQGCLTNKCLSCVGDPIDRMLEDPLRIIRAFRFASSVKVGYGLDFDQDLHDFILTQKDLYKSLLENLPKERLIGEIDKLSKCGGECVSFFLEYMYSTGVLKIVFPMLHELSYLEHNPKHHPEGNVLYHTLKALESYEGNDFKTIMSIVLHDIGKLDSYNPNTLTFHGHENMGSDKIKEFTEKYKLSNEVRDCMLFCCKNHMKMHYLRDMRKHKVYTLMESPYFEVLKDVYICDCKSKGDYTSFIANLEYVDKLMIKEDIATFKLEINGHDVIPFATKNEQIGWVLRTLKYQILDGEIPNTREVLLSKISEIISGYKEV